MQNKFIVDQKPLMAILASMQPICTKRTTFDATTYILFQVGHRELILKGTDLEISLQSSYILKESNLEKPYSFLVPGKRIFDLVKELDDLIEFKVENQQLVLISGSVTLSLHIKDSDEFPPFPERIENLMHLDASFLLEMLNKVAFLIPQNNANSALNGLLLEISDNELKMTTTDGHCLAQVSSKKYALDVPKTWLLPRRAILEVKKILESAEDASIFLGTCGNQLVFSGESFNFFTKLLADQFPEYTPILSKEGFTAAMIDKPQFTKTLRRSVCLLSGQFIATQFDFSPDTVQVSMHNKDVGTLNEAVSLTKFEGNMLDIRFYAPYLLNGLQAFSQNEVTFYLKNSVKPIIFEACQNDMQLMYLVMPVSPTNNT